MSDRQWGVLSDEALTAIALNALGLALADHGHVWTDDEKHLYDVLAMKGRVPDSPGVICIPRPESDAEK